MKKLIAIVSVLALMFAVVSLSAGTKAHADALWTEDPTISENEIPVYVMDSIRSTFPNHYDNVAKPDANWQGAARQYPWNEIRLQIKQAADGAFTGKEYAVFFAGGLNPTDTGTAANIGVFLKDAQGKWVWGRIDTGASSGSYWYKDGSSTAIGQPLDATKELLYPYPVKMNAAAMDPSLSHVRVNLLDEDLVVADMMDAMGAASGGDQGTNYYNRSIIYDGQGRAIWGVSINAAYEALDGSVEDGFKAEYCYVDGVVTKFADAAECDRETVEDIDPDTGEVTGTHEGENPALLKKRVIWRWVSDEEFDPSKVNSVPYLTEGWDPEKWDDSFEDEIGGGHVLVAFTNGANGKGFTLSEEEVAFLGEDSGKTTDTRRQAIMEIKVPAHGCVYDFGYLDQMVQSACEKFAQISYQGYKYGRLLNEDGEGMAKVKTYNFSAKPIYQQDAAVDGQPQKYLEGQQTIEVLKGKKIQPAKNVVYSGVGRYWAVQDDITSFSNDLNKIDLYIAVDGMSQVEPSTGYTSLAQIRDDFYTDFAAWLGITKADLDGCADAAAFHGKISWGKFMATNATNGKVGGDYKTSFMNDPAMYEKWHWLIVRIQQQQILHGITTADAYTATMGHLDTAVNGNYAGSPETINKSVYWFLNEGGHDYFGIDFANGNATDWMDTRSNKEKFDQFTIDTSEAAVDTTYVVEYRAVNSQTGVDSKLTIKFVIVDEYTPRIEVAKADKLMFKPVVQSSGKVENVVVDPYTLVTAYNAKTTANSYNGLDITYKVHFDADFAWNNVPQGEHQVTAKVYNETKYAEKTFTITVEDVEAPVAAVKEKVTLCVGAPYNPYDYITYALDNVKGDLLTCGDPGLVAISGNVKTETPNTYTVKYQFFDDYGNVCECQSKVTVLEEADYSSLFEEQADLIDDLSGQIDELSKQVEDLKAQISAGCNGGSVVVELLAAAALLALVLRKRH